MNRTANTEIKRLERELARAVKRLDMIEATLKAVSYDPELDSCDERRPPYRIGAALAHVELFREGF